MSGSWILDAAVAFGREKGNLMGNFILNTRYRSVSPSRHEGLLRRLFPIAAFFTRRQRLVTPATIIDDFSAEFNCAFPLRLRRLCSAQSGARRKARMDGRRQHTSAGGPGGHWTVVVDDGSCSWAIPLVWANGLADLTSA
jgi:hypothetical protein